MIHSSFTTYRHFCTRSLAVGGLRCSLTSISVLLLLQTKGIDEFRPEGARAAGGLGDFPPLTKQRELERVGLNEFQLLRQLVLHGGLVSFLLDFWQLSQDIVVISFE